MRKRNEHKFVKAGRIEMRMHFGNVWGMSNAREEGINRPTKRKLTYVNVELEN